jgi:hypothetical protein
MSVPLVGNWQSAVGNFFAISLPTAFANFYLPIDLLKINWIYPSQNMVYLSANYPL